MKESGDFHLLKLVFMALYSAAWPSYLKINELVLTCLWINACEEIGNTPPENDSFQDNAVRFFNLVFLFILKIAPILILS